MAIEEDLGETGDVTSLSVVPASIQAKAVLRCKEEGMVMAGQEVAERVFRRLDPECTYTVFKEDGAVCQYGDIIAEVRGKAQSLLTAERTALNFIQRLCGVATTARKYAAALGDSQTVVLDTRKTTPGYRNLEKYAVAVGGAQNHRIGLYDRAMIKDNHRELAAMEGPGSIARSVNRVREQFPGLEVEVEADRLEEVAEAADAGAEYILLDNMSNEMMAEAVKIVHGRSKLEASGGITLTRLASIGQIGVDFVSSGALTHSVKSADISLDIIAEASL
ncbi:MAG: carboxylating nicotinate-nucleotide diphosphorylase [Lentisphaeria bacterium]|nr:carboxylating nicotinate-nucleotide diphosphorylase [Lentisphaeria bacterium]